MLNEADTRAKLIDPKLHAAGWGEDRITREHYFQRDRSFTRGRIVLVGNEPRRREPKKVDYLLRYADTLAIAVVEAKEESHKPGDGLQQAKSYAESLGVYFAYSSNGHGFTEFDFLTNTVSDLDRFPTPDELWERWKQAHDFPSPGQVAEPVATYLPEHAVKKPNPLLVPYCPPDLCGREPFYFQEVAISRTIVRTMQGQRRLLLNMATGTGKTFVAFQIVWKLRHARWLRRVLFLADRLILRDQAHNTFAPFGDARTVIEEGRTPRNREIYFSIYQGMDAGEEGSRLYQAYPPDFFDLIIIDECHRSGFGKWREILDHFSGAVHLGMTATPKRDDNIDTYEYFGDPVYSYSLGQGIEDGFLATYKVHRVRTNVDRDGLHLRDAEEQGAEVFIPEGAEVREIYYTPQFEREITLPDRIARMSDHLASLLRIFGPMERTMVFCVDMDHAEQVSHHLQNHFAHLGFSDYAVRIVSEEHDARELLEQFRDSERRTPVVASTADLLTTGVDVPSARNIVFMKTVSSPVVFKQIVGRGSRTDATTGKLWFRVIDYTNATRLFDDWDRPPGEPAERVAGPRICQLEGTVVHAEMWSPIASAQVTVITRPNEQVVGRTDETGHFSFSELPEGELTVVVTAGGFRRRQFSAQTLRETPQMVSIGLWPEGKPTGKIKVKGLEVIIADETLFIVEETGQQLTLDQYIDYSRREILMRSPTLEMLREIWSDPNRREALIRALEKASIHAEVVADVLRMPEADQFDLLAHLAFEAPVHTRDERAESFRNHQQSFLNGYSEEAREALLALLEKYRLGGAGELSRPEVYRLPPFDRMGQAPGVVRRFGDAEKLRTAVMELQRRLYVE